MRNRHSIAARHDVPAPAARAAFFVTTTKTGTKTTA